MGRNGHQNGTDDKNNNIYLKCPFTSKPLSDYSKIASVFFLKHLILERSMHTEVAEKCTEEGAGLEG